MHEPKPTILIVEDDPDVRELATIVLAMAGYRVIEAANGDEAVFLLATRENPHIDMLFTDIVMPGRLDGINLAHTARELLPDLRVLYTTGNADAAPAGQRAARHGPVLRKPYRPTELRAAVRAVLGEAG